LGTRGYIYDDRRRIQTWTEDLNPDRRLGPPSADQNNWVIGRQVSEWGDFDVDGEEDDMRIKWLTKLGDSTWDAALNKTYMNVRPLLASKPDSLAWQILTSSCGAMLTGWLDYVRWVDQPLADEDSLIPAPGVPEPTALGLLALGGLALLRRRRRKATRRIVAGMMVFVLVGMGAGASRAEDVRATYGWEGNTLPSAAGWTDDAGNSLESLMSVVTTPDLQSAVTWSGVMAHERIYMDPAAIPGLPLGGAGELTIEVRHALLLPDGGQYYSDLIGFQPRLAGNLMYYWWPAGMYSDFGPNRVTTKARIFDRGGPWNAGETPTGECWGGWNGRNWIYDPYPGGNRGAPSTDGNAWITSRLSWTWEDWDFGGVNNDIHFKLRMKPGDGIFDGADPPNLLAEWNTVYEQIAYNALTITADQALWEIHSHSNGKQFTGWIDYVRWVDQYLEDEDILLPLASQLPGDANEDGCVDLLDLDILGQHYGQSGGWSEGDFSNDGTVNLVDLDILGAHYGECQNGGAVPEPATFTLLALGGLSALVRRRKQ